MNYSLLFSAIFAFPVIVTGQLVGSQHDEHNCVTDGGYHWCESTQSCVRPWVTPCHNIAVDPIPQRPTVLEPVGVPEPTPEPMPEPVPTTTQYCPQSQMQLCRMMCGQPNCPSGQCALRSGSCCDYICHKQDQHRRSQSIPQNCATWFDGCNTCSVDTSGNLGACTMMMCFTNGTPECRSYYSVNDAIPMPPVQTTLNVGDVCYRFCEDGSETYINRLNDCPSGTMCRASDTTSMISFDSCQNRHWTCQLESGH